MYLYIIEGVKSPLHVEQYNDTPGGYNDQVYQGGNRRCSWLHLPARLHPNMSVSLRL